MMRSKAVEPPVAENERMPAAMECGGNEEAWKSIGLFVATAFHNSRHPLDPDRESVFAKANHQIQFYRPSICHPSDAVLGDDHEYE